MTDPRQDGVRFAGEGSRNPSLTASGGGYSAVAPPLIGRHGKETGVTKVWAREDALDGDTDRTDDLRRGQLGNLPGTDIEVVAFGKPDSGIAA